MVRLRLGLVDTLGADSDFETEWLPEAEGVRVVAVQDIVGREGEGVKDVSVGVGDGDWEGDTDAVARQDALRVYVSVWVWVTLPEGDQDGDPVNPVAVDRVGLMVRLWVPLWVRVGALEAVGVPLRDALDEWVWVGDTV